MNKSPTAIHHHLESSGLTVSRLPTKELWALQQRWRQTFAINLYEETGKWIRDRHDWHVFSFSHAQSLSAHEAVSEYARIEPCSYLVLSSDARDEFGFDCHGKPADLHSLYRDLTVTNVDFEWTMAFTHESHCGPYFARA